MPAAGALNAGLVLSPGMGWSLSVAGNSVPGTRPIGLPKSGCAAVTPIPPEKAAQSCSSCQQAARSADLGGT